jgi:hypothetical protein
LKYGTPLAGPRAKDPSPISNFFGLVSDVTAHTNPPRQPNAPNAQPIPDANRQWCKAEAKQHSVSGKKQLLFKSVFCAESDYSSHQLVELLNVR